MTEAFEIKGDILTACHLKEEVLYIPDGVRIIRAGALKGCTSVKKVLLPETLERIEEHAFKGCRQLESISFPESLKFIGAYAFHRCHHLREIQLPIGITELSDCAFLYCDGLEQAVLPGVRKLGKHAFLNATNLKKLTISAELSPECISDTFTGCTRISEITIAGRDSYQIDNLIAIMEADKDIPKIIHAIVADIYHMMEIENGILVEFHVEVREVEIPEGIYEIGKSCFFDKRGILNIHLPTTLKKIGERAFRNCINLEHILFKNTNVEISKDAFQNCTNLKKVTLDGKTYSLTGLPKETNREIPKLVYKIYKQLLENFCISGTVLLRYWGKEERVTIPDGITVIGERAFAGNEAIGKLILPESVVEIQKEAFADCLLLQTLNFPKGLKKIGRSAFEGCVKLLRAEIPAGITYLSPSVFSRCKKLKQIIWEETTMLREIGQQAFYGCQNLSSFVFPESLEKIEPLAFYQCHSLKRITLPKSVFYLGAEAFACCKGIKEIEIKGNITKWGRNIIAYAEGLKKIAFYGEQSMIPDYFAWKCARLTQVIFLKSLKNIGLAAFEGTAFFNKLSMPKILGTIFLDGKELVGDVKIPEGITAIAGGAFYGNDNITSVELPDSLEFLGERAFCSCISLREIRLPKKVTIISKGVFAYCTGLKKVTAENEIKEVEEKACYQCSALQSVPSLCHANIGDYAFFGCKSLLEKVTFCSFLGAYAFKETGFLENLLEELPFAVIGETVVDIGRVAGEIVFPEGIYTIAPYACFGNDKITKVILPEGLKKIGAYAFCGCTELCEVVVPDSVEFIEDSAFEKCNKIITFSSSATYVGPCAFAFCRNLQSAMLSQVKELKKETFFGCCQLQTVEAKEIKQIGKRCFKGCIKLSHISINGVKEIAEEAFAVCESLREVLFSSNVWIAEKAFLDCCGLIFLSFEDSFARIDHSAFSGSTFLEKIQMDKKEYLISGYEDLFREDLPEFVKKIYASAISCFYIQDTKAITEYQTNARAIRIPNGINAIFGEVFRDCIRLEQVEIPESVTYIGERAFWGSAWLKRKKEKEKLVIINHILLDGTSSYGQVVIPENVHIISGWAFANCYGLYELILLNPRLIIEPHAFRNCIYLKQVTMADEKSYYMNGLSVRKDESLPYVIKQIFEDALNCYKTNEENVLIECTGNITNFALVKGITAIGNGVFQESNLLTYAALTEEVEWIGESAFARCKWLTCVRHMEYVKEIGAMAFFGCIRLESIAFSNCLRKIGKRAFENCTMLKEVVLPEGIKEIPERAFFQCRSLEKLVLPSSLERIEEEAFAFCDSLQEIVLPEGLKEIGNRGFAWCKRLKITKISSKVILAENAFDFSSINAEEQRKITIGSVL